MIIISIAWRRRAHPELADMPEYVRGELVHFAFGLVLVLVWLGFGFGLRFSSSILDMFWTQVV